MRMAKADVRASLLQPTGWLGTASLANLMATLHCSYGSISQAPDDKTVKLCRAKWDEPHGVICQVGS